MYVRQTLEHTLGALRLSGKERLLDVGCGTGEFERMAIERFPEVTIVGIDATPAMIELAQAKLAGCPGVTFHVGWADTLPFGAEAFDAVVCTNTLHHLHAPKQALREWVRVLRPRGQLIVVDWCRDFWHCRLMHYWLRAVDRTYATMPRLAELQAMAEELGLAVEGTSRFIAEPLYGMLCVTARKAMRPPT
ncbi:MAG: methyltransferase domain-containing protein [Candidatus Omnitrophica bacterium]|nr:methyltransferase domain-containing protein [Candidatus Omnitrophota bacterium]